MSKFLLGAIFGATCWTVILYYTVLLEQSKIKGEVDIKAGPEAKVLIDKLIADALDGRTK